MSPLAQSASTFLHFAAGRGIELPLLHANMPENTLLPLRANCVDLRDRS